VAERKKAMRLAKQLEKKVAAAADSEEAAQLQADLHVAQVDIDYAIYFPFMEPYVSLYAGAASAEKDETSTAAHYLRTPRPPMWTVVEKAREEGKAALERLQNRRAPTGAHPEAAQESAEQHPVSAKKAKKRGSREEAKASKPRPGKADGKGARANDEEEEEDESDGGFFE
jgi:hypothetical protein